MVEFRLLLRLLLSISSRLLPRFGGESAERVEGPVGKLNINELQTRTSHAPSNVDKNLHMCKNKLNMRKVIFFVVQIFSIRRASRFPCLISRCIVALTVCDGSNSGILKGPLELDLPPYPNKSTEMPQNQTKKRCDPSCKLSFKFGSRDNHK